MEKNYENLTYLLVMMLNEKNNIEDKEYANHLVPCCLYN